MLGVRTVGHATLLAYDGTPCLVTDPWTGGRGAFFGSWQLSHEIPADALEDMRACPFVWISHAHPDHLHDETLETLRAARLLVPDHVGGRMAAGLRARGFRVHVLPDRRWLALTDRIRVCCLADPMQNAVLLLDVNGRLFVDMNDASDRGWGADVRALVRTYPRSYLLKLAPTGHLGVLNVADDGGAPLARDVAAPARAGAELARHADALGVTHVIPFSSFHQMQRTDSAWANALTVAPDGFGDGFASATGATLLPAFATVDCEHDGVRADVPAPLRVPLLEPGAFGDAWHEPLERDERGLLEQYFRAHDGLRARVGFVATEVGGVTHRIDLAPERATGITLAAPRHSLVTAVRTARLDELLLSHFTRVTLHGLASVVPALVPTVSRWGDFAGVRRDEDVAAYLEAYRTRAAAALLAVTATPPRLAAAG